MTYDGLGKLVELQEENAKLKADNAFLRDVFEKQKAFIEDGINRGLENARLRAAIDEYEKKGWIARDTLVALGAKCPHEKESK